MHLDIRRSDNFNYLGTKEQFEIFKNNNKELFDYLTNIKNINFIEKSINDRNACIENIAR